MKTELKLLAEIQKSQQETQREIVKNLIGLTERVTHLKGRQEGLIKLVAAIVDRLGTFEVGALIDLMMSNWIVSIGHSKQNLKGFQNERN